MWFESGSRVTVVSSASAARTFIWSEADCDPANGGQYIGSLVIGAAIAFYHHSLPGPNRLLISNSFYHKKIVGRIIMTMHLLVFSDWAMLPILPMGTRKAGRHSANWRPGSSNVSNLKLFLETDLEWGECEYYLLSAWSGVWSVFCSSWSLMDDNIAIMCVWGWMVPCLMIDTK